MSPFFPLSPFFPYGDWGEPPLLDVFRYSEDGELLGSFPVYRGGVDEYMHRRLWRIFPVPGRMIFIHHATYFDGELWDRTFAGTHAGAIDLSTGEPVGEDAQILHTGIPEVRSGNRLGMLWMEREYTDEARTEWIEHQYFTVLDCTGLLGDL